MSVVPASRLSRSDLCLLGNNLADSGPRRRRRRRQVLAAVNRSLARLDERVGRGRAAPADSATLCSA